MSNYFLDNKVLLKYQSHFQTGHSAVHQLIEIYQGRCYDLDKQRFIVLYVAMCQRPLNVFGTEDSCENLKDMDNLFNWIERYLGN